MASYTVLPPTKKGEPRIKVTVAMGMMKIYGWYEINV